MQQTIILKKKVVTPTTRKVFKIKKPVDEKPVIKLKNPLLEPPPRPAPGLYMTHAMEAFENIREYCEAMDSPISQADIIWYREELEREKKELDEFWERCAVTKACMEGVLRGDDEWTIQLAENVAKQKVKELPIQENDIGPMPEYGTKDFWIWCHKRKQLKAQKDAAIIAAGGTVKEKKPKKPLK